ncbi:ABC transporter ATP-binding protein [Loktanella sp. S4079]|uniref:ABC transporter ATP-binding protein n=1 Tax=Loktanella sp. S4079 TaxID=579483 RepID=UPI0005F9EF00|nr:ATP-binding cassette domain-containing protein [Loktanella sp. S4079]
MSLLQAEDITIMDGKTTLLKPLSLRLDPGVPLVILGETGSGKSLMAQAIMGTLPATLTAKGRVAIGKQILNAGAPDQFRGLWGRQIGVLPQEPWLSLDPLMRARNQVAETHTLVRGLHRQQADRQARDDLAALGLAGAENKYPHTLSGGMAQRVAIAAARAGGARIVIADEPTKGLDAPRRDDVAKLLMNEMGDSGGLLVITHDLALAQRLGSQMIVLRRGEVVEQGDTHQIFASPRATYTQEFLEADPERWSPKEPRSPTAPAVVTAHDLTVARANKTLFSGVSFSIAQGHVFGVTGPSGCGKSSLGDALLGLITPRAGQVLRRAGEAPHSFQKLYQDPVSAFPRKRSLGQTLDDTVAFSGCAHGKIDALLEQLDLDPALLKRRPDAVSGGELQRLSLLRVLLRTPSFICADEPTSRLDPITQKRVIALLTQTTQDDGVALMLISHDTALIRNTADTVLALDAQSHENATPDVPRQSVAIPTL